MDNFFAAGILAIWVIGPGLVIVLAVRLHPHARAVGGWRVFNNATGMRRLPDDLDHDEWRVFLKESFRISLVVLGFGLGLASLYGAKYASGGDASMYDYMAIWLFVPIIVLDGALYAWSFKRLDRLLSARKALT
jgi:hypothetical protein